MNIEIREYVGVSQKLCDLGYATPNELAFLPSNFSTVESVRDFRQHVESDTVRKLLKAKEIQYADIFVGNEQPPYLQQYSFEWFGPTLFATTAALAQNPHVISVGLGLITNYLYDLFKGSSDGKASLNIVVQQPDGSCKEVRYSGPPEGLAQVAEIVRNLEVGH